MAIDFHERERLLLSKLLNHDDILSENRTTTQNGSPFGSSSSSGLSSPFGSELCSTETESEDDEDDNNDFIAELTRQMADYMLEEDDENENLGSTDHHGGENDRLHCRVPAHAYQAAFSDDQSRTRAVHLENQPSAEHQGSVCWGRRVIKRTELTQKLEQKQQVQHQKPHHVQNRGGKAEAESGGGGFGSPAWPPLQQRRQQQQQQQKEQLGSGSGSGSGMRAVFLGGPGSRKGSSGTGVFLPRGTGNPLELSKKKSGCSTVLIPARVIQALQLHFEDMKKTHRRSQSQSQLQLDSCVGFSSHPLQHDASTARSSDMYSQQKRRSESRTRLAVMNHQEIDLPQEWTY